MPDPACRCCYDDAFDVRHAATKLRQYRREGPGRASRALADALGRRGVEGRTVLDIGAGVGAVHQLLLERGAAFATDVDASGPYLAAAREEAGRRGFADRTAFVRGDFVAVADQMAAADLVALDRVVCCYGDVDALVRLAAERTRRRLGIVVPPEGRLAAVVVGAANAWERVRRSAFRMYVHPHDRIVEAARAGGLEPAARESVGMWRLLVFERPILTADSP